MKLLADVQGGQPAVGAVHQLCAEGLQVFLGQGHRQSDAGAEGGLRLVGVEGGQQAAHLLQEVVGALQQHLGIGHHHGLPGGVQRQFAGVGIGPHQAARPQQRAAEIPGRPRAQAPKLSQHIPAMQTCLAEVMGVKTNQVSLKATTTEHLGFVGREEGIAAYAVALIN